MSTLEILIEKIEELKVDLNKLNDANTDEKTKLQQKINFIEECEQVLSDEEVLLNYDFSNAFKLIEDYNYTIENLAVLISDIQNVLLVRHQLNLTSDEMPLEETQSDTLAKFIDGLRKIKKDLSEKMKMIVESSEDKKKITNLENLKKILECTGTRKYVTTDMFKDFYDAFDILSLSIEDAEELLEGFYHTKNLSIRQEKEKVDFNLVVEVYKEFLSAKSMKSFMGLLNDHKNEITSNIDIENTAEILQFFKGKNIIDRFKLTALLKISLYGKSDYIKDVIYPEIISNDSNDLEVFFEDELATVWIKEKGIKNYKLRPFRISRSRGENKDTDNLYATCHTVDYDEFLQNIEILKINSDLFEESLELEDAGAYLKLKTLPVWLLRKNIELCKLFGMGVISKVPITCLERGDIEDKIHLAIELGLLNSPITQEFLELDKQIVRNEEFQKNARNKRLYNQSIRNYFQRYLSMLSNKSINEYAFITYKLQVDGYEQFYNNFFSDVKAGQGNPYFITEEDRAILNDKSQLDDFITNNFMIEWYSDYINGFDEYDNIISEYVDYDEKYGFKYDGYFDSTILEDDLIRNLEDNNTVNDILTQNDKIVEKKNEFIYLFGNRIISRYKVLHNASILKGLYGKLTKEMLMTSIVRKSFLDIDSFQLVQKEVMERDNIL